jgi:hypothetical protein
VKPRKADRVGRNLQSKGFRPEKRDHIFYRFYVHGRKSDVRTKISHGATQCSTPLLSHMAKQVHLSADQFAQLLDCPLTVDDYIRILVAKGILGPDEIPRQLAIDETAASREPM